MAAMSVESKDTLQENAETRQVKIKLLDRQEP